jgi:predicted PurR-regulated permease PerM
MANRWSLACWAANDGTRSAVTKVTSQGQVWCGMTARRLDRLARLATMRMGAADVPSKAVAIQGSLGSESVKAIQPWITFAGCVVVVGVLYWAQAVLVPVALAALITFVLTPFVLKLQRLVGRVPAVLLIVALVFGVLGAATWGLAQQITALAADFPQYRANIRQKAVDIRQAGQGGTVAKVQDTLEDIQSEIARGGEARGRAAAPLVVHSQPVAGLWSFPAWLGPAIAPIATGGLVIVLVIFMLLEREDLRSRIIGLVGHGHLTVTTKAFDEAGQRVSRQLLMQTLVNAIYGTGVGIGLFLIGVPYVLLWSVLAAALRFIPYVGPFAAACAPILVALAVLPGWTRPLLVVGLFGAIEVFTNVVLETILYAGVVGVSQVALLIAVAFWTWIWGPMGLLLATPLTVCVVVLGKHVSGLEFLATLMADAPALAPDIRYYQRLLARDQSEAWDIIERHLKDHPFDTVYDALLLPALNHAEHDRLQGRLSKDEEMLVVESTRELMGDVASIGRTVRQEGDTTADPNLAARDDSVEQAESVSVLAYPANGVADELAAQMLQDLLEGTNVALTVIPGRVLSSELVATIQKGAYRILCIADLPPSPPSKTRYLVKKLRTASADLRIVVGRWAPPMLADETSRELLDAGADYVGATLAESGQQLLELARLQPRPIAEPPASQATCWPTEA